MQPAPLSSTIEFSVSYSLREYLSIVQDHLPGALAAYEAEQGKPPTGNPRLLKLLMIPVASVGFVFKKWQMPICHFRIDAERICRDTRLGTLDIPWADVIAVHRYGQGDLIEKTAGALPLPYRCLTPANRDLLEAILRRWQGARDGE